MQLRCCRHRLFVELVCVDACVTRTLHRNLQVRAHCGAAGGAAPEAKCYSPEAHVLRRALQGSPRAHSGGAGGARGAAAARALRPAAMERRASALPPVLH